MSFPTCSWGGWVAIHWSYQLEIFALGYYLHSIAFLLAALTVQSPLEIQRHASIVLHSSRSILQSSRRPASQLVPIFLEIGAF